MTRSVSVLTGALALAGSALLASLDATTLGDELPPAEVEWIIVPDVFGQGQWLVDSAGNEHRVDAEGWIEFDDEGVTLTVPWLWVYWRPLAGGKVSLAVGHG